MNAPRKKLLTAILVLAPLLIVAWIWFSSLSFVPVPWPDDSAFYFVGREFFKWPPRWVMLPQAPFEPTYRIFNFNTMPLYPLLVGLGRLIGIDGSHAIKLWPLAAYGLSGSLLSATVYLAGLPFVGALLLGLVLALDPGMRWAAVLVRPESLIGLAGVALVLGLSLGFPKRFRAHGLWHPVAALLAFGAYAHFNAVHLLFPVVLTIAFSPEGGAFAQRARELVRIALRCALYLVPWALTVALHPLLFVYQMKVQWKRLVFHNEWLDSPAKALRGIFQDMGSPEPWPSYLHSISYGVWVLILTSLAVLTYGIARSLQQRESTLARLLPASGWILGSMWLWETKPEVWFNYYVHLSVWTFATLLMLAAWKWQGQVWVRTAALAGLTLILLPALGVFATVDLAQAQRLGQTGTWKWPIYRDFVGCLDQELRRVDDRLGHPKPFRVWDPTFPDVTIELSRMHPDWEFTRTNDFWERAPLALQHGHDVEAVVITEMLNWEEREISAPQSEHPEISSVWMNWSNYFLNTLWKEKGWKPARYLCQRGRWQGFIFEK